MAIKIQGDTVIYDDKTFKVSSGNTAQRPASPEAGMLRFNTDLDGVESYNGAAWISNKFFPKLYETKFCGVSSITPNLKCGNFYNARINTASFCVCSIVNPDYCTCFYLSAISNIPSIISFPSCFCPNTILLDPNVEEVYQYARLNNCYVLESTACTRRITGDCCTGLLSAVTSIANIDIPVCNSIDLVVAPTGWCRYLCTQLINESSGIRLLAQDDNALDNRLNSLCCNTVKYNPNVLGYSSYICYNKTGYPYLLQIAAGSGLTCGGTGSSNTQLLAYNITENGLELAAKPASLYSISSVSTCYGARIVTHSVERDLIAIWDPYSYFIQVYKLGCLLEKNIAQSIQRIYFPTGTPCSFNYVKPFHDLDKCQVPAHIVTATVGAGCSIKLWKGTNSCPLCSCVGGSGLGFVYSSATFFCQPLQFSDSGEYLSVYSACGNFGQVLVFRDCGYCNCTSPKTYNLMASTYMHCCICSVYLQNIQCTYVRSDKDLCHIFHFTGDRAACGRVMQTAFTRTPEGTSYMMTSLGCGCYAAVGCGATCGKWLYEPACIGTGNSEGIHCICIEQSCAYNFAGGLTYDSFVCCWYTASSSFGGFANNFEFYGTNIRDLNGNLSYPYSLPKVSDSRLFCS